MPISQIEMLDGLVTVFEERMMDENCADNKMDWDVYVRRIIGGWTPDNFERDYALDCYRLAIKKLRRYGKRQGDKYKREKK